MQNPQAGQTARVQIPRWLMLDRGFASREIEGEVLAATQHSIRIRAYAVIRESQFCLRCGREIVNPISQLVGYGPECSEHLGIPRPETIEPGEIAVLRDRQQRQGLIECWLPKSKVQVLEVAGQALPQVVANQPAKKQRCIDHNGSQFVLSFPYEEQVVRAVRRLPTAKWRPHPLKVWTVNTDHAEEVDAFGKTWDFYLTPEAFEVINGDVEAIQASTATDADIHVIGLGGTLRPFQRAGVAYAVDKRRTFIADQMGLGKTIQALAALQHLDAYPAVIVVPASVKLNWEKEAKKWLPGRKVHVQTSGCNLPRKGTHITIVNYDILHKYVGAYRKMGLKAVVLDESHYAKNPRARRTKAAKELAAGIEVVLLLTGTAILNRPNEAIPQLDIMDRLDEFGGAAVFKGKYGHGANLKELNRKMRALCYLRREKADVLTELPPKQRVVLPMEMDNWAEYAAAEDDFLRWLANKKAKEDAFRQSIAHLSLREQQAAIQAYRAEVMDKAGRAEALVKLGGLKRLAAQGKLAAIKSWVADFLDSGEKLVMFAHHQETVEALARPFHAPTITGSTPIQRRQEIVELFQTDPDCRLVVLNMQAGGVGLTLTAASSVGFAELGWTPALHDQAEDRCHRIGQQDSVTAYYLLAAGTIEERIAQLIDDKRGVVDAALIGNEEATQQTIMNELMAALSARAEEAA